MAGHTLIKVTAKIINGKLDEKMVPKYPGPGSLQQAPAFVPEIGPAIKQFPVRRSRKVNIHHHKDLDSRVESTFYRPVKIQL